MAATLHMSIATRGYAPGATTIQLATKGYAPSSAGPSPTPVTYKALTGSMTVSAGQTGSMTSR